MGIMHQAVKNAVGDRRITDLFMPVLGGHLRSQYHRPALITVVIPGGHDQQYADASGANLPSAVMQRTPAQDLTRQYRTLPPSYR